MQVNFFAFLMALLLPFSAPFSALAEEKLPSVTVMADSSISVAVAKIARSYSQQKNVVVNTSFSSQKAQQQQISDGAAADILITTKATWIDELKQQGLIDIYSQTTIAKNRLVLVGSESSEVSIKNNELFPTTQIINSSDGEPMFLIGHPETSVDGTYAKESLRSLGAAGDLEPYTLYIKQPNQFFDMVLNQKAFGICFYSGARGQKNIKIIGEIPEASHAPINYYAVVIAGNNMNEARKFLQYLTSKEVRIIFRENGFF